MDRATFDEHRLCDLSILTSEQIEQNYYNNDYTVLLVKESSRNFSPKTSIVPSVLARVNNIFIRENNEADICFYPEKRVQVTEIVLKDGVFYGKAEEIVEPKVKNREELYKLRELIEKLIKVYQCEDYQGHIKYSNSEIPIFNPAIVNFETYAANLNFYIAYNIFGYDYSSVFDKNVSREFCSKSTIEKLTYLVEYIESTISNRSSKSNEVGQDKVLATDSSNSSVSSSVFKFTSSEELLDLAYSQIVDTNKAEEALESYNKVLEFDPSNHRALACKATILIYHFKQYQEAIDIHDKYPEIDQILHKGDAYHFLEKYNEAINCYDQVAVDSEYYIHSCYRKGMIYYKLGNYQKAVKSFDEMLKLNEQFAMPISKLIKISVLDALFHNDFIEYQEHNLKIIEEILITNPQSRSALILKMRLLVSLANYNEALSVSNKLLELNPDIPVFIYYKGVIFGSLARYEEALQYIDKAIMLNNSNLDWVLFKGNILVHFGKYQEAIAVYDKILSQQPENQEVLACKALTLAGIKKYDEALKLLEDVLAIDPTYVGAITRKGSVYFQMGNYQEAVKNYDKAIQLGENDSKVIYFRELAIEELRKLAIEEDLAYLIENTPLPPMVKIQATTKLNTAKSLNNTDNEKNEHIAYLRNLLKLPWGKYDKTNIDLAEAKKILEQKHYGLEEVKTRIIEALVFMTRSDDARPPILCLVGSPGVGKTSIANSVAAALQRKSVTLSLAGAQDVNIIRGCMTFYRGSTPGKVLTLISEAGTCNPVMVLDEIDKMDSSRGTNLEGALLQLLDPSQNANFTDDYFNFPFDLSKVLFIITANSLDKISYPLLNRMEVIEISGYTEQEKLQIANNYLMPKLLKEANLPVEQFRIDEIIIKQLIKHYTKESGVRDIERILRTIVQKYLVDEIKGSKPIVNQALIEQYLGTAKYQHTTLDQTAKVGTAIGLAYTASGGSTITVEAEKFPGEGKIKATGKLGEVLKESVEAALAYLKANAEELGINQQLFKKYDLHLHLPEGAIAKDGPSAGITIYVALASLLSGKKVRQDIAMTGELTLKGRVLPIGGLKEKLSAAVRENITTVIIPEGNKRDMAKISHDIKGVLTIKTISHANELLNIVFINKK